MTSPYLCWTVEHDVTVVKPDDDHVHGVASRRLHRFRSLALLFN